MGDKLITNREGEGWEDKREMGTGHMGGNDDLSEDVSGPGKGDEGGATGKDAEDVYFGGRWERYNLDKSPNLCIQMRRRRKRSETRNENTETGPPI